MDIHWKGFCFFYKCPQNGDEILNFWMAMCIEALKLSDRNQTKATTLQNSVYVFAVRILLMAIGTMAIFFRYILHHIEQGRRCIWHQNFSRTNKPIWKGGYFDFFFFLRWWYSGKNVSLQNNERPFIAGETFQTHPQKGNIHKKDPRKEKVCVGGSLLYAVTTLQLIKTHFSGVKLNCVSLFGIFPLEKTNHIKKKDTLAPGLILLVLQFYQ